MLPATALLTKLSQRVSFIERDGSTSTACTMLNLPELSFLTLVKLAISAFTITCWPAWTVFATATFIVEGNSLWFLKVDVGTIFNRNIIFHEDIFGIWCSVNFKPFYFNRTLVVVISSKLFPFLGGETDCSDSTVSVSAWIWNSKYLSWYTGDTLWCILLMCQNVTGFQPLLLREKRGNMKTEWN